MLDFVKTEGITQSILSAGKQEYVDDWVIHHQLKDYFIKVLGIDNHYASGKTTLGMKTVRPQIGVEIQPHPEQHAIGGVSSPDVLGLPAAVDG